MAATTVKAGTADKADKAGTAVKAGTADKAGTAGGLGLAHLRQLLVHSPDAPYSANVHPAQLLGKREPLVPVLAVPGQRLECRGHGCKRGAAEAAEGMRYPKAWRSTGVRSAGRH